MLRRSFLKAMAAAVATPWDELLAMAAGERTRTQIVVPGLPDNGVNEYRIYTTKSVIDQLDEILRQELSPAIRDSVPELDPVFARIWT